MPENAVHLVPMVKTEVTVLMEQMETRETVVPPAPRESRVPLARLESAVTRALSVSGVKMATVVPQVTPVWTAATVLLVPRVLLVPPATTV